MRLSGDLFFPHPIWQIGWIFSLVIGFRRHSGNRILHHIPGFCVNLQCIINAKIDTAFAGMRDHPVVKICSRIAAYNPFRFRSSPKKFPGFICSPGFPIFNTCRLPRQRY